MSIFVSILLPVLGYLTRKGISGVLQARMLKRPDIRDKVGVRAWLDNVLGWLLYLHGMFMSDLRTSAFVLANVREIVKNDAKWDALYAAILHDFVANTSQLMPEAVYSDTSDAELLPNRLLDQFCITLKSSDSKILLFGGDFGDNLSQITTSERATALQYISFTLTLLDQPTMAAQHEAVYSTVQNQP
jgi:hypothetical protein